MKIQAIFYFFEREILGIFFTIFQKYIQLLAHLSFSTQI